MSSPFLSELRLVAFNLAPKGWTFANGQLLPINQNQAIFALLGTTYGGDGRQNFALPNLQGRAPLHMGQGFTLGQRGGETTHTLSLSELPTHIHFLQGVASNANQTDPTNNYLANTQGNLAVYGPPQNLKAMFPGDVTSVGGSQPHANESPYLVMNWIIALQGIFPSQT
ncbi:MAG TPA: tail fiber protein [Bryobacteraceae bacterium]|nr:tail fiber protein [Bryobacteraceae bacterium]